MRWPVQSAAQSGASRKNCVVPKVSGSMIRRRERGKDHRNLVRICANRFKIMFVGEKGIGGSGKAVTKILSHGFYDILLPQEAVAATCAEVRHLKIGDTAQLFDLSP